MADLSPIETGAQALYSGPHGRTPRAAHRDSRTVLASLAQHRDDIARVLADHMIGGWPGNITCDCDRWPYDESDDQTLEGRARHQADAVLAWITREASS